MREILVMGHRGSPRAAPENTLKSYEIAMNAGVDMIELDVWKTTDDHMVCIHDPDVSSISNFDDRIEDLTLERIRSLDAGDGQQVPLLNEAFDLVQGRIGINIDLKSIGIEEQIVELIVERRMLDSVIVSSFFHLSIQIVKEINHNVKTGALFQLGMEDLVQNTLNAQADAIHPLLEDVTKNLIEDAHREGLNINVWNVFTEDEMRLLLEWGVDGIITDYPEIGVRVVDNWLSERRSEIS